MSDRILVMREGAAGRQLRARRSERGAAARQRFRAALVKDEERMTASDRPAETAAPKETRRGTLFSAPTPLESS